MPLENSSVRNLPFSLNNQSWPKLECNAASTALTPLPLQAAPESLRRLHRVRAAGRWRSAALQQRSSRAAPGLKGFPGRHAGSTFCKQEKRRSAAPCSSAQWEQKVKGTWLRLGDRQPKRRAAVFTGGLAAWFHCEEKSSLRVAIEAGCVIWSHLKCVLLKGYADVGVHPVLAIGFIIKYWIFFFLKLKCCPMWFLR